jgi:glycosyltransferase involved in cell wall biosynthesis
MKCKDAGRSRNLNDNALYSLPCFAGLHKHSIPNSNRDLPRAAPWNRACERAPRGLPEMLREKPRFVIADPSLLSAAGHHLSLTMQITHGAKLCGLETSWLTHIDFHTDDVVDGVSVYPVFSATMYDRHRPIKENDFSPYFHQSLLRELNKTIKNIGLTRHDHVFFHTGFGDLFRAIHTFILSPDWLDKPYLHICTPYDLSTMPGRNIGTALENVFNDFKNQQAVDKKVFLWAETPQLALHYTLTYGFNVRALPFPSRFHHNAFSNRKADDVLTVLYLGAAREEKGFLLIPQLVERLYNPYGRCGKLNFIVQCSPQIIGYFPSIRAAIDRLTDYSLPYVTLIDNVLSDQDYHDYLSMSDVVLLLYDRKNYRIRGSGIAVEAVVSDKCILTTRGTFCASLLTHGGGHAVDNVDEAAEKLACMVDKKKHYEKLAKRQGREYREKHSVDKYVARLIDQTASVNSVPFFPSSIVGHISPLLLCN